MNKKIINTIFLCSLISIGVVLGNKIIFKARIILPVFKPKTRFIVADTCVNPTLINRNDLTIWNGETVIDEACTEVSLEDGFTAEEGANYTAVIGLGTATPMLVGINPPVKTNTTTNAEIFTVVRPQPNKISLRWMPVKASWWKYALSSGFTIEKYEFANNTWTQRPSITLSGITKSDSLRWVPNLTDSTYQIAYEALRTQQDEVANNNTDDDASFAHFFFAAHSFNQKFDLALFAKYGYVDNNVIAGRKYRYRIKSSIPISPTTLSSGDFIEVEAVPTTDWPKTTVVLKQEKSPASYKRVSLEWVADTLAKYYTSYTIERSTDGLTYKQINDLPLVYTAPLPDSLAPNEVLNNKLTYTDSLANSTQKYYYRIVGKTYFTEKKAFDVVSIQLKKTYPYTLGIDSVRTDKIAQQHTLFWSFPAGENTTTLDSILTTNPYTLSVSKNDSADFRPLKNGMAVMPRSITFSKTELASLIDTTKRFYYRMEAITKSGDTLKSMALPTLPTFIPPPSKPTGFTKTVVENDAVKKRMILKFDWNKNPESNVMGYTIHRRIGETDSLYLIANINFKKFGKDSTLRSDSTRVIISQRDTTRSATDTLYTNADLPTIYYFLRAYNTEYKSSDSTMIKQVIIDSTRPLSPTIIATKSTNNSVVLSLIPSPEKNTRHELLRKEDTGTWTIIKSFTATQRDTSFTDLTVVGGKTYYYTYVAYDTANNMSCAKEDATTNADCYQLIETTTLGIIPKEIAINSFTVTKDNLNNFLSLNWTIVAGGSSIKEFEIYKAVYTTAQSPESLWKIVAATDTATTDLDIETGFTQKYFIRAVFQDGKLSDWETKQITN